MFPDAGLTVPAGMPRPVSTLSQAPTKPWGNDPELAEEYAADPKTFLQDRCALWVKNVRVMHNWIITATYYLPHKLEVARSDKGIIIPDIVHDEALWQGKVGLVLAMGPMAFKDDEHIKFQGQKLEVGEWVLYDVMEGRQFTVDRIHCRRMKDTQIVMTVSDPRLVY